MGIDITAVWLTFKLATLSTFFLLFIGTPIAWWLAFGRSPLRLFVNAVVAMPLVLPPTVLGFYLLIFMGPSGPLGKLMNWMNLDLLPFTIGGLVVGSVVYSMPFVVQPIQNAFEAMGKRPLEIASTLGLSPWHQFISISLPMCRSGFITATILGFAHTVGEFGVVLMLGGNIPGRTKVLSVSIYESVESMNYLQAHYLSGAMVIFSLFVLIAVYWRRKPAGIGVGS